MSPPETQEGVETDGTETREQGSSAVGASQAEESSPAAETPGMDDQPSEALCPVVEAVEELGSQWRLTVLHELQGTEYRFNELKRRTDANARTLSRVLDDLQELGFVDRRLEEDAPVATYYSLTEKGEALCPVFDELADWGSEWATGCRETSTGE